MTKTVKDLNPRSQAVKRLEMQVVITLAIIEAFDQLNRDEDWTDIRPKIWREFLGDLQFSNKRIVDTIWEHYKNRQLHQQVLDLYENLPPAAQKRKEIVRGINKLRQAGSSRRKGKPSRPDARG